MRFVAFICFVLFFLPAHAQLETDQQLAQHYYSNGEFDKATLYYERLFTKDPSKFHFNRYYECLIATGQIKEAEKILKKQISNNRSEMEYRVLLGQFYEEQKEPAKAQKIYEELIAEITPDANKIISLYNAFKAKGRNDLAFQTIDKGRKLLKNSYPLHFQFADYYGAIGQNDKMIGEYLDLLDYNVGYSSSIQALLSRQFDLTNEESKEYDLLRQLLLERTQKKPDESVYGEMLIWLFIQRKNFTSALTQAQSMDKRLNEGGKRVFELGRICVENKDYTAGRKAFQYVVSLGDQTMYYYQAENALLNTRFLEVTTGRTFDKTEIMETVLAYENTLQRIGRKRNTLSLIIEMSHIQAFYNDNASKAIEELNAALNLPGITDIQKSEIKMKLADIQVLHGDIWEASLLYMQVENDFKFETIGQEAKFKNARIFYYDGEFDFAQSQLNILKESTSKLIANDAMKLSVMITDNYGLDSNYQAMWWFAQGDLLVEQHKFELAFQYFDSIVKEFPYHSLGDEILMKKAEVMKRSGRWQDCISILEELLKYHGEDILADDATFMLGELFEDHLNDKEKAAEYYKKILFDFKGSLYSEEARKRYRSLRGEKIDAEEL
jgi:tetratricopeptide (TPR) repeat protein